MCPTIGTLACWRGGGGCDGGGIATLLGARDPVLIRLGAVGAGGGVTPAAGGVEAPGPARRGGGTYVSALCPVRHLHRPAHSGVETYVD